MPGGPTSGHFAFFILQSSISNLQPRSLSLPMRSFIAFALLLTLPLHADELPGHSAHGEAFNEGPRQAAVLIPGCASSTVMASPWSIAPCRSTPTRPPKTGAARSLDRRERDGASTGGGAAATTGGAATG